MTPVGAALARHRSLHHLTLPDFRLAMIRAAPRAAQTAVLRKIGLLSSMPRRRASLPWLLALVLLFVAAWFWVTPHRTYDRFLHGVAFGNEAELTETIDFPVLRQQLKDDITAAVSRRSRSRLGTAVAMTLVDQAVDVTLTPDGLSNLITAFGARTPSPGAADTLRAGTEVSFRYRSLSRVDVRMRARSDGASQAGILTFTRAGTRWRLTRIWSEQLLGTKGGA